jgi:hypothetical protein
MSVSFTASAPSEWLSVDVVTRILLCTPAQVLALIQDGLLNARNVYGEARISSASLDRYTASRPLVQQAPPRTFVKISGRVYEEIS